MTKQLVLTDEWIQISDGTAKTLQVKSGSVDICLSPTAPTSEDAWYKITRNFAYFSADDTVWARRSLGEGIPDCVI